MQLTQGMVKPSKATMLATRPTVFQEKLLSSFVCCVDSGTAETAGDATGFPQSGQKLLPEGTSILQT
jgi:hypothetical protein